MLLILGIEVPLERLGRWMGYLAPDPQPFLVADDDRRWDDIGERDLPLSREVRDTFRLWSAPPGSSLVWLSSATFHALPRVLRSDLVREQIHRRNGDRPGVGRVPTVREWSDVLHPACLRDEADGHRFVWWRELVDAHPATVLSRLVSSGRQANRHAEVDRRTWEASAELLPSARQLGGTWGPLDRPANCFSTVMEAAGDDPVGVFDDVAVFDAWLQRRCRPDGTAGRAGTVLVWRVDGGAVHAAVEIGGGWALEKASQEWHAARAVVRTEDVIRATRARGQRLERHTLIG